jgi:hypothetical protein
VSCQFLKLQNSKNIDSIIAMVCTTIEDLGGGQYKIVELPKPSLDELKLAKRAEINRARDAAEQGGFEYLGKTFDSDQVSAQRISMAAQAMALAPEGATITWTCQDNSTIDLTAQELVGLVVALAQHSNTCHEKATALKASRSSITNSTAIPPVSAPSITKPRTK